MQQPEHYREKVTGARTDRRELNKMLRKLSPGDVVTVTRIDRLARSTFDLFSIVKRIVDAKAQFRSLAEPWADSTSSTGRGARSTDRGDPKITGRLGLGTADSLRGTARHGTSRICSLPPNAAGASHLKATGESKCRFSERVDSAHRIGDLGGLRPSSTCAETHQGGPDALRDRTRIL